MARKRIGELLLERGTISRQQLEAGLAEQQRSRQRLGVTLVKQGVLTETQLAQALAESLGLATVDLVRTPVDWSAVHMLRSRFCETHELFPFGIDGKGTASKRLMVALSDPLNQPALDEIEFITGLKVAPVVSTHSMIREAILRYYHKTDAAPPAEPRAATGTGGSVRLVPPTEEPGVVMGEEIISQSNPIPGTLLPNAPDPSLEALINERMGKATKRKGVSAAVSKDLDFLFGGHDEAIEKLERKFWALMRLMARKGLISREEFLNELGGDD